MSLDMDYKLVLVLTACLGVSVGHRRIYGGEKVPDGQLPYQAAIAMNSEEGRAVVCGGAILDKHHVLTAGHCLENGPMSIMIGSVGLDTSTGSWHEVISYVTPYVNKTYSKDIAILRVEPEMAFSNIAKPVMLPDQADVPKLGAPVVMSGWGLLNKTIAATKLRKLTLNVVSEERCLKTWSNNNRDSRLCAIAKSPKGTCGGDSGGPLVSGKDNKILVGILSYGTVDCSLGEPEVYTNVREYVPWIKRQAKRLDNMYKTKPKSIPHKKLQAAMRSHRKLNVIITPGLKVLRPPRAVERRSLKRNGRKKSKIWFTDFSSFESDSEE